MCTGIEQGNWEAEGRSMRNVGMNGVRLAVATVCVIHEALTSNDGNYSPRK